MAGPVPNAERALVLFSGGQDSTVCLAWALQRFERVETIGFDYGQRHRVELDCRAAVRARLVRAFSGWAGRLGDDHLLDLGVLGRISDTALTGDAEIRFAESGLPTTFVPARNLLFFTFAAAVAYRRGLRHMVGGMCETDYSGYPDCRDDTLKALQVAINLGTDSRFVLHTPLMWIDKAGTWDMAEDIGGSALVDLVVQETHSCYRGDRSQLHAWGYGCGSCPACELRAAGHARWAAGRNLAPEGSQPG
ncbi:7-cyano-7-deazaguanine synthase [Constrictibacter sp. MBR-5]|uniref:7-cyano-7-deazaguanine synthase QueC n=1 Tax=Constrictibacter sp. MBR-5 TaxID=3156467 RepID=UPI003390F620